MTEQDVNINGVLFSWVEAGLATAIKGPLVYARFLLHGDKVGECSMAERTAPKKVLHLKPSANQVGL